MKLTSIASYFGVFMNLNFLLARAITTFQRDTFVMPITMAAATGFVISL